MTVTTKKISNNTNDSNFVERKPKICRCNVKTTFCHPDKCAHYNKSVNTRTVPVRMLNITVGYRVYCSAKPQPGSQPKRNTVVITYIGVVTMLMSDYIIQSHTETHLS